jgi:hypothetical protein
MGRSMVESTNLMFRRLRLFLRDLRVLEARANFAPGQTLVSWFSHRRSYLTLQDARWEGIDERAPVAIVRIAQLLWVSALDPGVPLTTASAAPRPRDVLLRVEGGLNLRATFHMTPGQRLADYLESSGAFVPAFGTSLLRSGRPPRGVNVVLGDIAINQEAIQAIWEAQPARMADIAAVEDSTDGAPASGSL